MHYDAIRCYGCNPEKNEDSGRGKKHLKYRNPSDPLRKDGLVIERKLNDNDKLCEMDNRGNK